MTRNIQAVQTQNAPAAIGPYSQGIMLQDMLFVSGQIGVLPESGEFAGADFISQAAQALKNVQAIVEAGGLSLNDVVAVDVYVTDMDNFQQFNEIYVEFFQTHKPARAVIEISRLPKDALVEIKAIAGKTT
jgi:2-iminobutanoate/2-iminopropanoate deaminase